MLFSKNRFYLVALFTIASLFTFNANAQTLSCHTQLNISLNDNCETLLDAGHVLTNISSPAMGYSLELRDSQGNVVTGNLVTEDHLWTTLMATVTLDMTGNSCWANILVEDKFPPTISCEDITIDCWDASVYEPTIDDNCSGFKFELVSETIMPIDCDDDFIKLVVKNYKAVDDYGNESLPCEQRITLNRINLDDIVFPPMFKLNNSTNLTCTEVTYDADGFPDISVTGVPTLNNDPIFPNVDVYCNIGVSKTDRLMSQGGCTTKFIRTWRVYEAHCTNGPFKEYVQDIEISDTEDPSIKPFESIITRPTGGSCEAIITLPLPDVMDDCSGILELDISYDSGFLNNVNFDEMALTGPSVIVPAGTTIFTYTVYDDCENSATQTLAVIVDDNTDPVAVCDKTSIVSIRSDGTAKAFSSTFNDGSKDDCSFHTTLVRRLNSNCDCQRPEFDNMSFLGDNNGRFYYLSQTKVFGFEASAFATAYGGMLLVEESLAEHEWVSSQVGAKSYYNALGGSVMNGFAWPNGATPNFTDWEMGQPSGTGASVIVNDNGNWEVVDGNAVRAFFVMETSNQCGFSDEVHFCCADAGNEHALVLRAIDSFGRINECQVTVEVQDKISPSITCPVDVTVDCDEVVDDTNIESFGEAIASDQCGVNITSSFVTDRNSCGIGSTLRTFTASDANTNAVCEQTIFYRANAIATSAEIIWPENYETNSGCTGGSLDPNNLPSGFDFPNVSGADCTDLWVTYKDQVFQFSGNSTGCRKILRTWTVEDMCMDGIVGYTPETYEQSIKINDGVAPSVISGCSDLSVVANNCSSETVNFDFEAIDNCTSPQNIVSNLVVQLFGMANSPSNPTATGNNIISFTGDLPVGEHNVVVKFDDQCGNTGSCTKTITVSNTQPPSAICNSGINTVLQEMDLDGDGIVDGVMTLIRPEMLDNENSSSGTSGSSSPCGYDIELSFSATIGDDTRTYTCDDLGLNPITLFVIDEFGATSTCNTTVFIQDFNDLCTGNSPIDYVINGEILTEKDVPVEGINVDLQGSQSQIITNQDGSYTFPAMPEGNNYMIEPTHNKKHLNGISTLDLILIQNHILGQDALDSPYKLIAADADHSGDITAIDIIQLRKLILGVYDELPENSSWRMIDKQFNFADPSDPFLFGFKETYNIQNLNNDMDVDFVGVKIGDVNNSVIANINDIDTEERSSEKFNINVLESEYNKNEIVELVFTSDRMEALKGFQLEIFIDPSMAKIKGFKPLMKGMDVTHASLLEMENGIVKLSWNADVTISNNEIFKLFVEMKTTSQTSAFLKINENQLAAEAYVNDEILDIDLEFRKQESGIVLYQNMPNPWSDKTDIKYFMPVSQNVVVTLYDVNGRTIYQEQKMGQQGINVLSMYKSDINQSGVFYYELVSVNTKLIHKMIIID